VTFPDYDALVLESKPDIAGAEVRLAMLRRGAELEHDRIVALLDTYDITELQGGVIMLEPKRVTGWQGDWHESGSLSSYFRRGCRCDACKGVASAWQRERKAAKKGVPSPQEILEARSPAGGWTRETLAGWGIAWPPPKGWKADLEERYAEIIAPKTKKQMAQRRQVTFQ
jgi:hypothetical protein